MSIMYQAYSVSLCTSVHLLPVTSVLGIAWIWRIFFPQVLRRPRVSSWGMRWAVFPFTLWGSTSPTIMILFSLTLSFSLLVPLPFSLFFSSSFLLSFFLLLPLSFFLFITFLISITFPVLFFVPVPVAITIPYWWAWWGYTSVVFVFPVKRERAVRSRRLMFCTCRINESEISM